MASAAIVQTKDNNESIYLSIDTKGYKASTTIALNQIPMGTFDKDVTDFFVGTNKGLENNKLTITTIVFDYPSGNKKSKVDFKIDGASNVILKNPTTSTVTIKDNEVTISHLMVFYFQK